MVRALACHAKGRGFETRPPRQGYTLGLTCNFMPYQKSKIISHGKDLAKGNIIGLLPVMEAKDYQSIDSFTNKIESYLLAAKYHNLLNEKTIIVFPEYIGTWLVFCGFESSFGKEPIIKILSNEKALFQIRAKEMCDIYQKTFSSLAKKYKVTLVAGTIVLPNPEIVGGKLAISTGPLYNICAVYKPDGLSHDKIIKKIFLTKREQLYTSPGSIDELSVFSTPAGNLGVLICADSWYPESYLKLRKMKANLLAIPSFVLGDHHWAMAWNGYDGHPNPKDVSATDLESLSEKEAWLKYSLPGRIKSTNIKYGILSFLRGDLWNLGSDGMTISSIDGKTDISRSSTAITNIYINKILGN